MRSQGSVPLLFQPIIPTLVFLRGFGFTPPFIRIAPMVPEPGVFAEGLDWVRGAFLLVFKPPRNLESRLSFWSEIPASRCGSPCRARQYGDSVNDFFFLNITAPTPIFNIVGCIVLINSPVMSSAKKGMQGIRF